MTSFSYGRVFCLESQKIDGTYQTINDTLIILEKYYLSFTNALNILYHLFLRLTTENAAVTIYLSWSWMHILIHYSQLTSNILLELLMIKTIKICCSWILSANIWNKGSNEAPSDKNCTDVTTWLESLRTVISSVKYDTLVKKRLFFSRE